MRSIASFAGIHGAGYAIPLLALLMGVGFAVLFLFGVTMVDGIVQLYEAVIP